jgi:signal transduction histidine kinase/ABC-type amino acid transport substrate-binding protein
MTEAFNPSGTSLVHPISKDRRLPLPAIKAIVGVQIVFYTVFLALFAAAGQQLQTIIVDNYQPYTFQNEKGEADGFSVDIVKAVSMVMDIDLKIRTDTWQQAMKELEQGTIDLLPMMAYSDERGKLFDFSVPHTIAYDTIFFKSGRADISSVKDLAGKTVVVMNKDAAHSYLLSSGLSENLHIQLVDTLPEALRLISSGQFDTAIMPKLVGMVTAKRLNLTNVDHSTHLIDGYNRPFSFAVKNGNQQLLEKLNQGLNIIKHTGVYDTIYVKWFGTLEKPQIDWKWTIRIGAVLALCLIIFTVWNLLLKQQVNAKTRSLAAEIDKRKANEKALQMSETRLLEAQRMADVGNWEFDISAGTIWASDQAFAMYGLKPSTGNIMDIAEVEACVAEREKAHRALIALIEKDIPYDIEIEVQPANGKPPVVVHSIAKCIRTTEGIPLKVIGVIQNITESKQAEAKIHQLNSDLEQRVTKRTAQLEAANKELEAFCYSVSHDLRAPLRHIDGYVDLLVSRCRDGLNEKGLHYVATIADSARQMGKLIDDLLQFSRTGRAEMSLALLDMNKTLEEALIVLQDSYARRIVEWDIGKLPSVSGDYPLLRQVWVNLLGNALKYTGTREIARITVSAREDNGEFIFVVADNGVGFDMQYVDKLFGVFQRLHRTEEFEGTGIGLATVDRIIARHGGRVWAEAEPNQGAKFFFTLPK